MNLTPEEKMRAYYESVGLPFPEVEKEDDEMPNPDPKPSRGLRTLGTVFLALGYLVGILYLLTAVLGLLAGGFTDAVGTGLVVAVLLLGGCLAVSLKRRRDPLRR